MQTWLAGRTFAGVAPLLVGNFRRFHRFHRPNFSREAVTELDVDDSDTIPRTMKGSTPSAVNVSAVHKGVAFEERSMRLLRESFSMSLSRKGGRNDGGVDLIGWWWVPPVGILGNPHMRRQVTQAAGPASNVTSDFPQAQLEADVSELSQERTRIRVLGQCKAEKKKMGPNYVREMEGVLYRHMHAPSPELLSEFPDNEEHEGHTALTPDPIVALLISESLFTRATILHALSSPVPFLLVHLPLVTSSGPSEISDSSLSSLPAPNPSNFKFGTMIWNNALGGTGGVLGGELELRWERNLSATQEGEGRPGLWWKGKKLESWTPDN